MADVAKGRVKGFLEGVEVDGGDNGVPTQVTKEMAAGEEDGLLEATRERGGEGAVDA